MSKSIVLAVGLFCFSFQIEAATAIYGPKRFYGAQPSARVYSEVINVPTADLNRQYTIKIINADGQAHLQQTCHQSNFFSRLACLVSNVANALYVSLVRVQKFDLKNNGTILISSSQVNKNTATFTATLNLSALNNLNLVVLGAITSSLTVEILKENAPADTTPPLVSYSLNNSTITNNPNTVVTITDASATTTTVWVNNQAVIVNSKNKLIPLVLDDGLATVIIQSVDDFGNKSTLMTVYGITVDTHKPNVSSDIVSNYYTSQLPYYKGVKITSNENLSFIQINNQSLLQVGINEYVYLMEITSSGGQDLSLTAIDMAGNETNQVLHTNLIVDVDPPVVTTNFIPRIIIANYFDVNASVTDISSTVTHLYVDNVEVSSTPSTSFSYQLLFPTDQEKNLKIVSTDEVGNSSVKMFKIARNTQPLRVSIISPQNQSVVSQMIEVRAAANKPLSRAKINGQLIVVSDDQISIKTNLPQLAEGNFSISVEAFDIYGNTVQQSVSVDVNFLQTPSWAYEECPAEQ